MNINFETPRIIGILCCNEKEIPKGLIRKFAKYKPKLAVLPFEIEKRYLKNALACMRLMDIHALLVCGNHQTDILRYLPNVDANAKRLHSVDVIVKNGKKFVGKNLSSGLKKGLFYQTCVNLLTKKLF